MPSLRRYFFNPTGLRAGWRLAIYYVLVLGLGAPLFKLLHLALAGVDKTVVYMLGEVLAFTLSIAASLLLGHYEKRSLADYGLPWRRMFRARFWQGAALGLGLLTATLLVLRVAGVFEFGTVIGRPGQIALFGAAYLAAFVVVALKEEFYYRGYSLFTLTDGIGFWPAALASSAYFGLNHYLFAGVSWPGAINIAFGGLVFCLMLRRTGDLWMAIGCHTALNFAEVFIYGVPDSGQSLPGSLLHAKLSGPAWLTGGATGPEGSLVFGLLLIVGAVAIAYWLPTAKYPVAAITQQTEPATGGRETVKDKG